MINEVNHLILTSSFLPHLSLNNGKMGSILFFYKYYTITNNSIYRKFAETLLCEITEEIDNTIPVGFFNGISGIGWGVEYLKYKKHIKFNTDNILTFIDLYIMKFDPLRLEDDSFEYGIEGIVIYILSRFQNSNNNIAFDKSYLNSLFKRCNQIEKKSNHINKYIKYIKNGYIESYSFDEILKYLLSKDIINSILWQKCYNELEIRIS